LACGRDGMMRKARPSFSQLARSSPQQGAANLSGIVALALPPAAAPDSLSSRGQLIAMALLSLPHLCRMCSPNSPAAFDGRPSASLQNRRAQRSLDLGEVRT
jgi:hypothetical protein